MPSDHSAPSPEHENGSREEERREMHLVQPPQPASQDTAGCIEVTLRPYRPADLQAMTALDQLCFSGKFLFGETLMEVLAGAAHAITIVADGPESGMAAFAIVHRRQEENPDAAYLVTIDVRPELRRCGIGSGLLRLIERLLREAGVHRLELHVHTRNHGAIRFYEGHGYTQRGRIPHFYGAAHLDAFLYAKVLARPVPVAQRPRT